MTMTKKFKILGKYIKDMSSETKDTETFIFVKEHISRYQLDININSKAIKNKMIEINTIMKFEDKHEAKNKSYFEITFGIVVQINDEVKEKKELERIIICDVQSEIYPYLENLTLYFLLFVSQQTYI